MKILKKQKIDKKLVAKKSLKITGDGRFNFSQQAHAPPTAIGGASEQSEHGRSTLFKN